MIQFFQDDPVKRERQGLNKSHLLQSWLQCSVQKKSIGIRIITSLKTCLLLKRILKFPSAANCMEFWYCYLLLHIRDTKKWWSVLRQSWLLGLWCGTHFSKATGIWATSACVALVLCCLIRFLVDLDATSFLLFYGSFSFCSQFSSAFDKRHYFSAAILSLIVYI